MISGSLFYTPKDPHDEIYGEERPRRLVSGEEYRRVKYALYGEPEFEDPNQGELFNWVEWLILPRKAA